MIAKERLYLTADSKRLVREGDRAAASLYAAKGDEIPDSAVQRFGLKDGTIGKGNSRAPNQKEGLPGQDKEKAPGPDKEKTPDGDKGGGRGTKGAGGAGDAGTASAADDLTRVKFIGAASVKALSAAGITSFAQLAAIDPAKPPQVEGMGARVNWSGIVASAIELHEAEPGNELGGEGGADAGAGQTGA
ncbi:hypothetical protein [Sphingopyxis sp. GW247-27LB]|uniref:hypothetical protein n=1 Tax=Sphingopyxis sp. GW247-27LB TaxID=2012632 RepID=UPI000BA6547C|nr:hypothetical protein [Sphingopyxis sp. GW247-27LB]PAL20214.1 hypothetical protein CD928_17555 [Sphingopyxis sp. GW247-27LB]